MKELNELHKPVAKSYSSSNWAAMTDQKIRESVNPKWSKSGIEAILENTEILLSNLRVNITLDWIDRQIITEYLESKVKVLKDILKDKTK